MNFGQGGAPGGGYPPFNNAAFMHPGVTVSGVVPPMMMGNPQGLPVQQLMPSYPQGQGPLAGRPAQVGANGLYVAPEPEGPEEHGT